MPKSDRKSGRKPRRSPSAADSGAASAPPPAARRKLPAVLVLVVIVLGITGYLGWRWWNASRAAREWVAEHDALHQRKITARLTRCLSSATAQGLRRVAADIRRGTSLGPLDRCRGPLLSEVTVAPMDFGGDLRRPPGAVDQARARMRDRLDALQASLTGLQRAVDAAPNQAPYSESVREAVATALEDVAVDVDNEQRAYTELVQAVRGSVHLF